MIYSFKEEKVSVLQSYKVFLSIVCIIKEKVVTLQKLLY